MIDSHKRYAQWPQGEKDAFWEDSLPEVRTEEDSYQQTYTASDQEPAKVVGRFAATFGKGTFEHEYRSWPDADSLRE
jgi:hypothetical protein